MRLRYILGLACGVGLTSSISAQPPPAAAPVQPPAQTGQAQLAQNAPIPGPGQTQGQTRQNAPIPGPGQTQGQTGRNTPSPSPGPTQGQTGQNAPIPGPGQTQGQTRQNAPIPGPGQTQGQTVQAQPGRIAPAQAPAQTQGQTGQAQTGQTGAYPISLYRMNDVSKSLNLTPDQISSLNKLTEQMQAQYRDSYAYLNSLNSADRAARLQELNRQYNSDWNKGASAILNENQRSRYQQFNNQYGGFSALNDPDIRNRLTLTVGQVNELRTQEKWSNQQLQDINRTAAADPTKAAQMFRDYLTQSQQRIDKFLTPEQRKRWLQMTGDPWLLAPSSSSSR